MKKTLFATAAVVLSVASLVSCQKESGVGSSENAQTVTFNATEIQTKTVFGDKTTDSDGNTIYPTLWTANDAVAVSYNFGSTLPKKATITPSEDSKSASFSVEITKDESAESQNFYIVSPFVSVKSITTSDKAFNITIPTAQTAGENTCDPSAQILVAKYESENFANEIDLNFSHLTAYGNLTLNLSDQLNIGTIKTVALTANKNISGVYCYTPTDGALKESTASQTITITTDKTSNIFFACAPVDLSGGSLNVTITTTDGDIYERDIDLTGKELAFNAGRISTFSVGSFKKNEEDKDIYTLVTDASTLKIGDHVIIAAEKANYAISTNQSNKNRTAETITRVSNTIINPSEDVQIFTLEAGTVSGTYAFNTGDGYIYTNGKLQTKKECDASSSWKLSCTDSGVATVTAQSGTKNILRYNQNGSSPIFNCYASTTALSETITAVAIFTDGKGTGTLPLQPIVKPSNTNISIDDNETVNSLATTISGADKVTCNVYDNAEGTGKETTWLTADYNTDDNTIDYVAAKNDDTESRTAYIIITATNSYGTTTATITVTQNAFTPTLTIEKESDTVASAVEDYTLNVTSNTTWTATTDADWLTYEVKDDEVYMYFGDNTSTEARTAIFTLTTTDGSISKTFTLTQNGAGAAEIKTSTYTFTSKSWETTENVWKSIKDGGQLTANQGVQITAKGSGAGAKSTIEFNNVSKIIVKYCTNKSSGAGTINIGIGDNQIKTEKITAPSSNGTTLKEIEFNYDTAESGIVSLTVGCTANSIYIYSITIVSE